MKKPARKTARIRGNLAIQSVDPARPIKFTPLNLLLNRSVKYRDGSKVSFGYFQRSSTVIDRVKDTSLHSQPTKDNIIMAFSCPAYSGYIYHAT